MLWAEQIELWRERVVLRKTGDLGGSGPFSFCFKTSSPAYSLRERPLYRPWPSGEQSCRSRPAVLVLHTPLKTKNRALSANAGNSSCPRQKGKNQDLVSLSYGLNDGERYNSSSAIRKRLRRKKKKKEMSPGSAEAKRERAAANSVLIPYSSLRAYAACRAAYTVPRTVIDDHSVSLRAVICICCKKRGGLAVSFFLFHRFPPLLSLCLENRLEKRRFPDTVQEEGLVRAYVCVRDVVVPAAA